MRESPRNVTEVYRYVDAKCVVISDERDEMGGIPHGLGIGMRGNRQSGDMPCVICGAKSQMTSNNIVRM